MSTKTGTTMHAPSCWTDEYLLSHCERYFVETPEGRRVGIVERVCWDDAWTSPEPTALIVRALDGDRAIAVSPDEVVEIRGWAERIVVPTRIADELREPAAGTTTGTR